MTDSSCPLTCVAPTRTARSASRRTGLGSAGAVAGTGIGRQTAYQVRVAMRRRVSGESGLFWDSGRVLRGARAMLRTLGRPWRRPTL